MSVLKPIINTETTNGGILGSISKGLGLDAKSVASTLDIPTIGDIYDDGKSVVTAIGDGVNKVYVDFEQNLSTVGDEIADTKNQAIDTIQYGGTLVFILLGGGVLLYGPQILSAFDALYERVKANGVSFNFQL